MDKIMTKVGSNTEINFVCFFLISLRNLVHDFVHGTGAETDRDHGSIDLTENTGR